MTDVGMTDLTFEEFCDLPWTYVTGLTTDARAAIAKATGGEG